MYKGKVFNSVTGNTRLVVSETKRSVNVVIPELGGKKEKTYTLKELERFIRTKWWTEIAS